jgi:hypothetical protein
MTRGAWQESAVVRVVQERAETGGKRTQCRVYEMADGCFLQVLWDGSDKLLMPEPIYGSTSNFILERRASGRRVLPRRRAA